MLNGHQNVVSTHGIVLEFGVSTFPLFFRSRS